jgi:cysteine desulfurase
MRRVYLDHSATTPPDPAVLEVIQATGRSTFGNASSVHSFGREARAILEESREQIARFIGARPEEIFFTSGGTESNNYAVQGVSKANVPRGKNQVITTEVEHHSVLHPVEQLSRAGFTSTTLPVDHSGLIDPEDVRNAITDKTCLISVMHANNEVGTIEPVESIGLIAKDRGIPFHSDAVQTLGKIPIRVDELNVDLLSFSAHKLYGPKGIGALYIRRGTKIESLIHGGGQESNRRAGTENVPLAAGFAKAVSLCAEQMKDDTSRFAQLKKQLTSRLVAEFQGLSVNGNPQRSLANILSVSFDSTDGSIDGEALIMGMDLHGVAVTSSSACTSGTLEPSHVLLAMGRDERTAAATIRFSFGRSTTFEEIDYAVDALREVVATMHNVRVG